MRNVTTAHTNAWLSGDYSGPQRAMQRATIQRATLKTYRFDTQVYSTMYFGQTTNPRELPNIKSISWQRSIDADAASCTIELYNTEPLTLGAQPDLDGNLDQPGYYTFNRGRTNYAPTAARWAHATNTWQDYIVPDRIIKTYEGYGYDPAQPPELDTHMVQSGVWLIDDVEYTADGLITINCRDLARLLLDQIMFPPVIPMQTYPLQFETRHEEPGPTIEATTGGYYTPTLRTDSNEGGNYQPHNGLVYGHRPEDAFDNDSDTYWMSIGNSGPRNDHSYEYIEASVSGTVSAVAISPWAGPYRMYVSVYANGAWRGQTKIPYNPNAPAAAPNGSDVKYVTSGTTTKDRQIVLRFSPIDGATRVRVTFTNLYDSDIGNYRFQYRAGVRKFKVSSQVTTRVPSTQICGNIDDYTDIVKRLLAYGGFWWSSTPADDVIRRSNGSTVTISPGSPDPVLNAGRVWGDILVSGTAPMPEVPLGVEIWDKKPLMDGINYVRDILGFTFFVDEYGSAVFRFPNVSEIGNYAGTFANSQAYTAGTAGMVIVDEQQTLLSLTARLSSRNVRERVFVSNEIGSVAAIAAGHNPFPTGMRRSGGWTDMHFKSTAECKVMAELITLQQVFTYRTDKVTIPGYSRIQIDDQIRLLEATTSEDNVHYVKSISSSWDLETGRWTYELDTQWLGGAPDDDWVYKQADLSAETRAYINGMTR